MVRLGVVFDMDDTLYLERDYVASGFRAVAAALGDSDGTWFQFLWSGFEAGVRGSAFDRLLTAHPALAGHSLDELVATYRMHRPDIGLPATSARALLDLAAAGHALGLITDGPVASQTAKVEALGLADHIPTRILTGFWGPEYTKPHERSYREVSARLDLDAAQLVYVADNPAKDFLAPNRLGWKTVRLRCQGQLHYDLAAADESHSPQVEIETLAVLQEVLDELVR